MAKLRERGRETDARRGLLGNIGSLVTPCHGVTRVTGLRSDVGSLVRVIREGGPGEMMCQHRESAATQTGSLWPYSPGHCMTGPSWYLRILIRHDQGHQGPDLVPAITKVRCECAHGVTPGHPGHWKPRHDLCCSEQLASKIEVTADSNRSSIPFFRK